LKQSVKTGLIALLKESAQRSVSLSEWERSYEKFAGAVFAAGAKNERVVFYNSLCFTKAELIFWQSKVG
jgi:hypothetical protein